MTGTVFVDSNILRGEEGIPTAQESRDGLYNPYPTRSAMDFICRNNSM